MDFDYWRNYARGWLFHFVGREQAAFDAFAAAFHHNPRSVQAARHLAGIAAHRSRFDTAEKWFETVLALEPGDSAGWFNLGFVRERAGQPERALAAFDEALKLDTRLDRAWYGKGLALARLARHEEAAQALEEAVALQPMNDDAFYQLGMAYHHANRPDEVKRVVRRLLEFAPKRARRLVQDAERADLVRLLPELPF
jgi:tetratricopeptide (TPR) repeat protein